MRLNKKAQIEVTFNWVYILVAGAIILIFFASLIVKQQASSQEYLATDVVRIMDTIFTGAGVSEKTKNFIDTSGLADYIFYFSCQEGVGEYGIEGRSANIQNTGDPLFAPLRLQSTQIITWSLPYKLPFKVIDFLYVTSPNTIYQYYGFGDFVDELEDQTKEFSNFHRIFDIEDYNAIEPGLVFQIRVVDIGGNLVANNLVPTKLRTLADNQVTAVSIQGDMLTYYQKRGIEWEKINPIPLQIFSVGGERDAAKFAAIFAGSPESYQCNMGKAFKRLKLITELYLSRAEELEQYYKNINPTGECINLISGTDEDVKLILNNIITSISICKLGEQCSLNEDVTKLVDLNNKMSLNCIPLY